MEGPMRGSIVPPVTIRTSGDASAEDWRHRAACRDEDPELFFPVGTGHSAKQANAITRQISAAKRVCAGCPVRQECRDFALANGSDDGIYGGLTADERRTYRFRPAPGSATARRRPATRGPASSVDVDEVARWRAMGLADEAIAVHLGLKLNTMRVAMGRAAAREVL
jgi:WhiB family transcriptional regulator, redox-sensing transcriptional regulator